MPGAARLTDQISHGGQIVTGSDNVLIDGLPAARLGDVVACDLDGEQHIVTASPDVLVNGIGAARIGDRISCNATIVTGSDNVLIDE